MQTNLDLRCVLLYFVWLRSPFGFVLPGGYRLIPQGDALPRVTDDGWTIEWSQIGPPLCPQIVFSRSGQRENYANIVQRAASGSSFYTPQVPHGVEDVYLEAPTDVNISEVSQVVWTRFLLGRFLFNTPPVASAGPDQLLFVDAPPQVTLDGRASEDADGNPLTYVWRRSFLQIATGNNPTITLEFGVHEIVLSVTDTHGATAVDTVWITVNANAPPTACAAGTYQPASGGTSCIPAPPGSYVDQPGAAQATPCAPGTFQPLSGQTACQPAPVGSYVDSYGATAATPCLPGLTTLASGARSAADCVDITPPELYVPGAISTETNGPDGAAVSFAATATDVVDASPLVSCLPPSGSTFAIGVTAVRCAARDYSGNTATGQFTVTVVVTPSAQILRLTDLADRMGANSAPLGGTERLLSDGNPSNDAAACGQLSAFTNQVRANRRLTPQQRDELTRWADWLMTVVGCRS